MMQESGTVLVPTDTDAAIEGSFRSELESKGEGVFSLSYGYPGHSSLGSVNNILMEASVKRLEDEVKNGFHLYQYGFRLGDPLFRESLAEFLTEAYGYRVKKESLMATNGASPTLLVIANHFFKAGDYVFAEEPSYPLALDMLTHDVAMKLIHVPLDENGISTKELEATLDRYYPAEGFTPTDRKPYWSMLYMIPTFQNPTGCCLSEDRCETVVHLARKYHLLVLCDDVYAILQWGLDDGGTTAPAKILKYYDKESDPDFFGNVVSNCSFSKFMAPGLRLGWIEAPRIVLKRIVTSSVMSSGGDCNHFLSGIMGKALQIGRVEQHVSNVCTQYKKNLLAIHAVFEKHLRGIVSYTLPKGGFFLWVQLPDDVGCDVLLKLCSSRYNVEFAPGTSFTTNAGRLKNFIRVCFSFYEEEQLIDFAEKVSSAILELYKPTNV